MGEYERERRVLEKALPSLLMSHPDEHVVIVGDQVVGVRPTEHDAIEFGFRTARGPAFFTRRIASGPAAISIPTLLVR